MLENILKKSVVNKMVCCSINLDANKIVFMKVYKNI